MEQKVTTQKVNSIRVKNYSAFRAMPQLGDSALIRSWKIDPRSLHNCYVQNKVTMWGPAPVSPAFIDIVEFKHTHRGHIFFFLYGHI